MNISVLGSINVDMSVKVPRFPLPGETITGSYFFSSEGGKGANQAVALAKIGADVTMLGKVGADIYGKQYLSYFAGLHLNSTLVSIVPDVSTGVAVITINEEGQNNIAVIPGANALVDDDYVESNRATIINSDYLLLQLEIPLKTVLKALEVTKDSSVRVVLDPAPAISLPDEVYKNITYITPNETETEILTGIKICNASDAKVAASFFMDRGVKNVVIKAGSNGAYLFTSSKSFYVPCFNVNVVDTTAAGDTFNGAFVYALSRNMPAEKAVLFANAASAIKIQGLGAQRAMPVCTDEIERLMLSQPHKKPVGLD